MNWFVGQRPQQMSTMDLFMSNPALMQQYIQQLTNQIPETPEQQQPEKAVEPDATENKKDGGVFNTEDLKTFMSLMTPRQPTIQAPHAPAAPSGHASFNFQGLPSVQQQFQQAAARKTLADLIYGSQGNVIG